MWSSWPEVWVVGFGRTVETPSPKQFIDVLGTGKSLLQMTYNRFLNTTSEENILVVTNDIYSDLVKEQLPNMLEDHILTEPARRNTAPCIAYAAYKIRQKDPNAVMVVTPAGSCHFSGRQFHECDQDSPGCCARFQQIGDGWHHSQQA